MRMKRIFKIFVPFFVALAILSSACGVFAFTYTPEIEPESKYVYMVYLGDNGDTVVYNKNSTEKTYPASLTKIMTAIVLLDKVGYANLESTKVTVPQIVFDDFYDNDGKYLYPSTADFQVGEEVDLKDLAYGMLLQSACEAANIIAYQVGGGDIGSFIDMMNQKAQEIGAVNTHFVNPHGLYSDNQYTTAYDMYLITKYAMKLDGFMEIAGSPAYDLKPTNVHSESRMVTHTNYMLSAYLGGDEYYYEYAKGIKTGTLDEAGRCLITTASKDGYNYLIVSLGGPLVDEEGNEYYSNCLDHKALYEWAFDNLSLQQIVGANEEKTEFSVRNSSGNDYVITVSQTSYYMLLPNDFDKSKIEYILPDTSKKINAPIDKGEVLGEMEIKISGESITKINLTANQDVKLSSIKYAFWLFYKAVTSTAFKVLLVLLVIALAIYIYLFKKANNKKREKAKQRRINK